MATLMPSLIGFPYFVLYLVSALVYMWVFTKVYTHITPYNEWKLIKEDENCAAAMALGGSIIGFSLALASAATNSVAYLDFAFWGLVAMLVQLLTFAIIRFVYMPRIICRIKDGQVSAGAISAAISISVGLLNAACMSY